MVVSSLSLVFFATRVGVYPDHCDSKASGGREPPEAANLGGLTPPARRAIVHGFRFHVQGVVFLLLLDSTRTLPTAIALIGAFALVGFALAFLWRRWETIPHALDMCFGMLTLGNLGMLLGWWADNGFAALHDDGCCNCVAAMREGVLRPWMWIGMLALANVAMIGLGRRLTAQSARHIAAMLTGGNIGMVLGMFAGGWCATQVSTDSVTVAVALQFRGNDGRYARGDALRDMVCRELDRDRTECPRDFALVAHSAQASRIPPDEVERREAEADDDHGVAHVSWPASGAPRAPA